AISTQKDALGPAFSAQTSPNAPIITPIPTRKRAAVEPLLPTQPKKGRKTLLEQIENGVPTKWHRRTVSHDSIASLMDEENRLPITTRSPRIKLKFRIPDPLITHHSHIPPVKQFNSLNEYLDSYIQLDDHEDTTLEKAQLRAIHEANIYHRIEAAKAKGWLTD